MNLANKITLARIFLVPIVMIFLLFRFDIGEIHVGAAKLTAGELIATFIFILAAVTDGVDGYIARRKKMVTNLGKFLDPLADKLLVTTALISLVELQRLEAWMAIVIISREFAVTGLRMIAVTEGHVIAASPLGKLKTIIQIVAIVSLMLNNVPFSTISFPFSMIATWLAVIITVISGVDYFYKNRKIVSLTNTQ
ncbi:MULTISPECIES: CDP-diacylglycerol--glycerol-3-phosphate 3-phosphatidyltransferase [Thermoactinomyces]|jgi:CDP-diacylglycerol---glycerol-3-phosphate 3-phosphatidyltransferase|uniref:CDP-diacylglycerol--glycerol-3-phosphate 3-phosphatidyltransferase n=2 Tax=Thermoactinomyces TaxID=2023 RepID=A0A8I1A5B3_THEIN|nr:MULTISPECIES: CDP-diacylglycerol--glycerol-3-phosphate 3-phosphatidyltransferase [Thermoactinomyces]KFZ39909.1 CDP-diacylglycerol--glycerol-3-phosphate 3-phosphatidyltransferase [Thermoactinomyces sp. Gus2-1]KYQ85952.1 CDP-diacylglycerol--glycerol-3-phosphate 3-phosphatidyltransferase [Thermoactinomyces sp. AS95]MBA4549602.1 CDP-diacylglycerol--glycerol-3-phosphate 3-phosphatidyltransferase [Thermoactinomyces intermedius]MBA4552318.1 CDP-diacylglycerol--glycerol-3-phosphate 3-phosphatidyltra